jgi:glycine C-acetyltransferase
MNEAFLKHLGTELEGLKENGLYKRERELSSPQQSTVTTQGKQVINLCSNNYLGLANHPALIRCAQEALPKFGFGLSSVRFICGTQVIHKELERELSRFLGTEDTTLYSSCFDANGGVFEALFGAEDAIISDSLNHASIIDGVRLSKAQRLRYANNDMKDLEQQLIAAAGARFRIIVTDGVFSMDGTIANLPAICELADKHGAMVMVDDSHAVGFVGPKGRGTHEHHGVMGRIDILSGTLGKALGGASGGYISGRKEIVLEVLKLLNGADDLREKVHANSRYFRGKMEALGFRLVPGEHPIIPVMLGDARLAQQMAEALLAEGVYVVGFAFPVVPKGQARIRTQMSAAHTTAELDRVVAAFAKVGKSLGVIR